LASPYASAEWAAAFHEDPTGKERKLVPVRVRECSPDGLGPIVYADVVGLSEVASRGRRLLEAVAEGRSKPVDAPAFPGFPHELAIDPSSAPLGSGDKH
jgi:hypothetical protein